MSKKDSEKALLILQKIFISKQGPESFKSHLHFLSMAQAGSRKLADVKAGTEAKSLSVLQVLQVSPICTISKQIQFCVHWETAAWLRGVTLVLKRQHA